MHFTTDEAERLDKVLERVVEKKDWIYYEDIEEILQELKSYEVHKLLEKLQTLNRIHSFEILEIRDEGSWFKANKNTEQFLKAGGFVQFIMNKVKEQETEKEQKELQQKKLRLDVRNSERMHKTYWWTFTFSVLALLISLTLLILKLFFENKK